MGLAASYSAVCLVLRALFSLDTCWGPTADTVVSLTLRGNLAVCAKDTMAPGAHDGQPIPRGHTMAFTPADSVLRKHRHLLMDSQAVQAGNWHPSS